MPLVSWVLAQVSVVPLLTANSASLQYLCESGQRLSLDSSYARANFEPFLTRPLCQPIPRKSTFPVSKGCPQTAGSSPIRKMLSIASVK